MNNNNIKPNYYGNNNFFTPTSLLTMNKVEVDFTHSNCVVKGLPIKSANKIIFKAVYDSYTTQTEKREGRKAYSSGSSFIWYRDATNTIVFLPPMTFFLSKYIDNKPDAKKFDWGLGILKALRQAVPSFKYLFLDVRSGFIGQLKKGLGEDAIIRPYISSNGSDMCIFIYEIDKIKDIDKIEIFDPKLPDTIKTAYDDYSKPDRKEQRRDRATSK